MNFYLHDTREVFRANYFDVVLNLFSSFGYYDKERDNIRSIIANSTALKAEGFFVFDYINAVNVRKQGEKNYTKEIENITFNIHEYIDGNFIKKKVSFHADGTDYTFMEQLYLLDKIQIEGYFKKCGLMVTNFFGNYQLESFDTEKSERLILTAKKINQR